ncbi:MAG: hypothetical protein ABIA75_10110 [Candidatus Neomarinimicrobiota bacterium]
MKQHHFLAVIFLVLTACSENPTNSDEFGRIYILSVVVEPTDAESVTIMNNIGFSINISGWTLGDSRAPQGFKIPEGTVMKQSDTLQFTHDVLGFKINNIEEVIYLKNRYGRLIDIWESES